MKRIAEELRYCHVPDCDRPFATKLMCKLHYGRWLKHGRVDLDPRPSFEEKFWSRVEKTETCWLWRGSVITDGYGMYDWHGRRLRAHRLAYELAVGEIPPGLSLDHRCHVRSCVNPDHLRPVLPLENAQNHQGARPHSTTGVRGVFPARVKVGGFIVVVKLRGEPHWGGRYNTLAEAEAVAIKMRNELHTHNDRDRVV